MNVLCICMYSTHVYMHAYCMYVCMYVCMLVCMYVCMYVCLHVSIINFYILYWWATATLADILANSGRTTFSPTTAPYEMMHPLGTTAPLLMTAPSQMMDWVTLALSSITAPDQTGHTEDEFSCWSASASAINLTFPNMRLHNLCTAANAAVYNNKTVTVTVTGRTWKVNIYSQQDINGHTW